VVAFKDSATSKMDTNDCLLDADIADGAAM
jgi:hypothetical protein